MFEIPVYVPGATPSAAFVEAKLRAARYWPEDENAEQVRTTEITAQIAVAGAIERFLKIVRWKPFISTSQSETRYFNYIDADGVINLGQGLLSLEGVKIAGLSYSVSGPTANVYAEPANAASEGLPYSSVRLWASHFGGWNQYGDGVARARELRPNSIEITGIWGQYVQWPADAFEAVVNRATGAVLVTVNTPSDIQSVSVDGLVQSYDLAGPVDPKTSLALLATESRFTEIARAYAKPKPRAQIVSTSGFATRAQRFYPTP